MVIAKLLRNKSVTVMQFCGNCEYFCAPAVAYTVSVLYLGATDTA